MDFVSHAIVGGITGSAHKPEKRNILFSAVFSVLPDISLLVPYFVLGFIKNSFLWIPSNTNWDAFRVAQPGLTVLWDITHSVFFLLLVIVPLVFIFKWPRMAIVTYLLHIITDMMTHSGDWVLRPLFPINAGMDGFIDSWALPWWGLTGVWIFLLAVFLVVGSSSFLVERIKSFKKRETEKVAAN